MSTFEKQIAEAPNYIINEKGEVLNSVTRKPVTQAGGSVRLTVDGKRKFFNVEELKKNNLGVQVQEVVEEVIVEKVSEEVVKADIETAEPVESNGNSADTSSEPKPKEAKKSKDKKKNKDEKPKETPKAQTPSLKTKSTDKKPVNNGSKKDKAFYDKVRAEYDKNPDGFDIKAYAKKEKVSYGRIWSIIKIHKAKGKQNKAEKNEK